MLGKKEDNKIKRNHLLKDSILELLMKRIEQEEFSSRLYRSMSFWLKKNNYNGAAKLYLDYASEEDIHAEWVCSYLFDLNILPEVPELKKPKSEFSCLKEILEISLDHEIEITKQCNDLAELCNINNDYSTLTLANLFLTEQTEEISKASKLLGLIDTFGDSKESLLMIDKRMGKM